LVSWLVGNTRLH